MTQEKKNKKKNEKIKKKFRISLTKKEREGKRGVLESRKNDRGKETVNPEPNKSKKLNTHWGLKEREGKKDEGRRAPSARRQGGGKCSRWGGQRERS